MQERKKMSRLAWKKYLTKMQRMFTMQGIKSSNTMKIKHTTCKSTVTYDSKNFGTLSISRWSMNAMLEKSQL